MDFILLTKRLRRELTDALSTLHGDLNALHKQTEEIAKAVEASSKRQESPQVLRAELQIPQAPITHQEAPNRHKDRRELFRIVIEVATFFTLLVYAIVTYCMWKEMVGSTDAAQRAVDEARRSRVEAEKSLTATINQFRLEQRAWVGISPISLTTPVKDSPFHGFEVFAENSGKTPSNGTLAIIGFYIHRGFDSFAPNGEDSAFMEKMITGFKSGRISQNDLIKSNGLRARKDGPNGPQGPSPSLPSRVFIGAMPPNIPYPIRYDGQVAVSGARGILYGRIYYEDLDRRTHTTSFCYYSPDFERLERIIACPVFNEMN